MRTISMVCINCPICHMGMECIHLLILHMDMPLCSH